MTLEEAVDGLYDLDVDELRRLAYEALLISDGPAGIVKDTTTMTHEHCVVAVRSLNRVFKEVEM